MPHSMVGFLESHESITARNYRDQAGIAVSSILREGKIPILVSGTGFYLRAFLYGMYPVPDVPESIHKEVLAMDEAEVVRKLRELDEPAFLAISENDFYRYRRALEVNLMGVKWSSANQDTVGGYLQAHPEILVRGFFLDWDRAILYDRINQRVRDILPGLLAEAKEISRLYGRTCPGLQSLGYNFALDFLDGKITVDSFTEGVAKAHRNYAKRQITWFRKEPMLEACSWDFAFRYLRGLQLLIKKNKNME